LEFLGDLTCLCADCHEKYHGIGVGRDGQIKLTRKDIFACRTAKGGWRNETIQLLTGERPPPKSGWKARLRGTMISVHVYAAALRSARS
jgi:hypothetical protein